MVIETSSPVLHRYLEKLISRVAIELAPNTAKALPRLTTIIHSGEIAESVRRSGSHSGGLDRWLRQRDAELVDERGTIVEPRSLLLLLAREAAAQRRGGGHRRLV